MPICYLCGEMLTSENESEEHIILNALGGRYKSKKLLCKNCNNKSGTYWDAILANQYHFFTSVLELDLERGKTLALKMKEENGVEYILKNGISPELSHASVKNEKIGA